MKDMLADIMQDDNISFPESPIHRNDDSLAREINSLREFEKEIPRLNAIRGHHNERMSLDGTLKDYAGQAITAESEINEESDAKDKAIRQSIESLQALSTNWENLYTELRKQSVDTKSERNKCETSINALDKQYDDYEDQDMEQKSSDLENLGAFNDRLSDAQTRYNALNENVRAEENSKNQALANEGDRYNKERQSIQSKLDDERQTRQKKQFEFNDKRENIRKREQDELESVRQKAEPKKVELLEARALAKADAGSSGPTGKESLKLNEIDLHVQKLDSELVTLRRNRQQTEQVFQQAERTQNELNSQLNQSKRALSRAEDELEELHMIAYAANGTWLKKLRENDPAWALRIGKVIDPKLLQRKDLDAGFNEEGSHTIFGWSLNLDPISIPKIADSEDQLRHEYNAQEKVVQLAKDGEATCERKCGKANKSHKDASDAHELAKRLFSQAETKRDEANRHGREVRKQVNVAIAERKLVAKKEVENVNKKLGLFEQDLINRLELARELFSEEASELNGAWSMEDSRIGENILRMESNLSEASTHHKNRKNEIESDFLKACSEKGIDMETLAEAKGKVENAQKKVAEIKGDAAAVTTYREWMKTEYTRRDELISKHEQFKQAHTKVEDQIKEKDQQFKNDKSELKKRKTLEERALRDIKEKLDRLNQLKPRLVGFQLSAEGVELKIPLDLLLQEINSTLEERENLKVKIVSEMQSFNSKAEQYSETKIAEAWKQARENLRTQLGYDDVFNHNFLLNLPQALDVFIDQEIENVKSHKIESLRIIAKGFIDYFEKLMGVHKRIRNESRKITDAITKNMKIDALSKIELELSSKIQDQDYWSALKGFNKSWQAWRNSAPDSLPEQKFVDELSELIGALQNIKSGQHLRDFFDLCIRMTENGSERVIRNDHDLDNSTSDGLKYLALCVIYIGMSRLLCTDQDVKLHWPVDEIGILHGDNVSRLFSMLNQAGIVMVGGFPSDDPDRLRHFTHRQVIDINDGVRVINLPESTLKDRALARLSSKGLQS